MTKTFVTTLMASVALMGVAVAQTSGTGSNATGSNSGAAMPANGINSTIQFMTSEQGQVWRGSKLMGVNIYGPNNEKVGDVNEILVDHQGNVKGIVIGVGGFLGIGEKDVAVPFTAVQWVMEPNRMATTVSNKTLNTGANKNTSAANGGVGTGSNMAATGNNTAGTANTTSRSLDTTGTTVARNDTVAARDMDRTYPDHGVISLTKDQLKGAPSYRLR